MRLTSDILNWLSTGWSDSYAAILEGLRGRTSCERLLGQFQCVFMFVHSCVPSLSPTARYYKLYLTRITNELALCSKLAHAQNIWVPSMSMCMRTCTFPTGIYWTIKIPALQKLPWQPPPSQNFHTRDRAECYLPVGQCVQHWDALHPTAECRVALPSQSPS